MDATCRRRILYIGDDTQSRSAIRNAVEGMGYAVVGTQSAVLGVETALREAPAMILLEMSSPDFDGGVAVELLRTFPSLAATPIVALADDADARGRRRATSAGCNGLIEKPIDARRIGEQIYGFLHGTRESPAPTDFQRLTEQLVARLLAEIDEARKISESLARADEAMAGLTCELGVQPLLDILLPRFAEILGVAELMVELYEPPGQRIVARAPSTTGADLGGVLPAVEHKQPLVASGRTLGVLHALYPSGTSAADGGALLRGVALRVATAIENAQLFARENDLRRTLEAQHRRKDDFLAVLAHELRAPLAPILSAAELIASPATSAELLLKARDVVRRQVRYQQALLDDLLDLTRVAHDRLELRRRVVDLRGVIAAAIEVSRPSLEARRQTFSSAIAGEPVMVAADPIRLEQVVVNLLANATKYTPVAGEISIAVERDARTAIIRVQDSGEGIPVELLGRIFDPFVRASSTGVRSRSEGLGLGLAVAKRIVELHGGTIEAYSAGRDRGSEFLVRLPLAVGDEAGFAEAGKPQAPRVGSMHILIVEDDEDSREMLRVSLAMAGHRVAVAETGREAVRRVAELRPDVMIVDLGLPDIDGYEVARLVRAALGEKILLVAVTGYGRAEDVARATSAGYDAHLLKPATVESLASILAHGMRRADAACAGDERCDSPRWEREPADGQTRE
jgi:signal transduction histidine kinase/DNA-binding response OmpR family regulator